jgi:hypothetical protein
MPPQDIDAPQNSGEIDPAMLEMMLQSQPPL